MSGESKWTADDIIFVCGDFTYIMRMNEQEAAYFDELAKNRTPFVFVTAITRILRF